MVNIEVLVGGQIALLREKDLLFRRRLTALQGEFGGGARLAAELDELEAADRAFADRVGMYDWQAFVTTQVERLQDAVSEELPVVDDEGRIVFYFDLERAEIGLRGRGEGAAKGKGAARRRLFGRQEMVLDLAAVFDELVGGGQHTSRVYPIVFSHDAERNRRLVVASVMIALLWPELVRFVRGEVIGERFETYRSMALEVVANVGGDVLSEFILGGDDGVVEGEVSAVALGFGVEREIERQLDAYVEVDAEANFSNFLKERREGALERRDFVEPFGRTRSVRLDRGRSEIVEYKRERSILTIKRAVRLVDPAPFERSKGEFASEKLADGAYVEIVRELIMQGFRQIYEEIRNLSGDVEEYRGEALVWEEIVEK